MNRRGIALLMALVSLLLITGLATAILASARLRLLAGSRQLAGRRAIEAARGAVDRHSAEWDSSASMGAAVGIALSRPSAHASSSLTTHDSLVRLGASLFLVKSSAVASSLGGTVIARDGASRVVQVIPAMLLEDSLARVRLEERVLRSSRDNVAMLLPVTFITNGWARWP